MDAQFLDPHSLDRAQLSAAVAAILLRLPPEHAPILQAIFGINSPARTISQTVRRLGVSRAEIRQAEARAMRMLIHPAQQELLRSIASRGDVETKSKIEVRSAVEAIRHLTPELISHLQKESCDLLSVRWDVFEHLIAELLAAAGFQDVCLVGRDASSAADIFAAYRIGPVGTSVRYFIEVKRWRNRVGVEVVDRVYGAMLAERQVHGWHAALIVSVVGFADFKKYSRSALRNMGIELKDKSDIERWLGDYQPDKSDLWLPNPKRTLSLQDAI